ncbi:MAG: alkaline phosphatase family protein [Deltaproteobacteria bacterium]
MILVVGWDGACFDLVDPWLARGELPCLGRLLGSGARRELNSTRPASTFPAWTSFMTAAGPGRHGIVDFTVPSDGYGLRFVNASYRSLPTIWRLASDAGLRVGVYGFPATYPAEELNGIQVCGFDTPLGSSQAPGWSYPPGLAGQLRARYGDLAVSGPAQSRIGPGWHDQALAAMKSDIAVRGCIVADLIGEGSYDIFAVHFMESDTVAHHFWQFADKSSPRHVAGGLADGLLEVYRALDRELGRLVKAAGPDTTVVLLSDHGSGPTGDRGIAWNSWLAGRGWLGFDDGPQARLRAAGAGMLRRAALAGLPGGLQAKLFGRARAGVGAVEASRRFTCIDWRCTRAYSEELSYHPSIRLNIAGREPCGVVPAAGRDRVIAELTEDLLAMRDPVDDGPVVLAADARECIYDGPYVELMPDLLLTLREPDGASYACLPSRGGRERAAVRRMRPDEMTGARGTSMPGSHRATGMLAVSGPPVRAGSYPAAELSGAGATVLALAGLGTARGMDGRPLADMLDPDLLARPPDEPVSPVPASGPTPYGDREEAAVAERLRNLGYIA